MADTLDHLFIACADFDGKPEVVVLCKKPTGVRNGLWWKTQMATCWRSRVEQSS